MSTRGIGELDAQRGQRQGLSASIVRHDEMMFVVIGASGLVVGCSLMCLRRKGPGCRSDDVGVLGNVCFAVSSEGGKNATQGVDAGSDWR